MKVAIVILSDPNAGEEATGRAVNGLAAAYDLKQRNDEVTIVFQGAGSRWASVLAQNDYPFHGLYELVKDRVAGVSCACSDVFGARAVVEATGLPLLTDNKIPGTSGLASFASLIADGYTVLTF